MRVYSERKESESLRAVNRSMILKLLASSLEPMARNQIAEQVGLTAASVTRIIDELIKADLVVEKKGEVISSTSGRRPIPLMLNPQKYFVGCIHIGNFWIDIGLMNLQGEVSHYSRINRPAEIEETIQLLIRRILEFKTSDRIILSIGVTLYGQVDLNRGIVLEQNILGWNNVPIVSRLESATTIKTVLDTNIYSMAVAEYSAQPLPHGHVLLFVNIGTTIGVALVVNSIVIRGKKGLAGMLEHIPWNNHGPQCECGNRGCLTSLLTDRAILNRAKDLQLPVSFNNIDELINYSNQEHRLLDFLEERAHQVGEFIARLSLIHDPSRIVLSGTCTNDKLPQLDWVRVAYEQCIGTSDRAYVKIESPKNRQNVPFTLIGAGTIALNAALSPDLKLIDHDLLKKQAVLPL